MAPFNDFDAETATSKVAEFWRVPIGAASPLWAAYAGAASLGVTYWWMSQWMRPVQLEAFKLPMVPETAMAPMLAEALAAVQPEPVALEPMVDPDEPAAVIAQATAEAAGQAAEAVGEAALVVSMAADDLTRLVGIGPTLASKLGDMGVRTFADIASWSQGDLEKVDRALDLKGRATREAWVDQARQFAAQ